MVSLTSRLVLAGWLALLTGLLVQTADGASGPRDRIAALVNNIAADQDPRVSSALARMKGTDRRLLALRSYLRAGTGLAQRWSWTTEQIAAFEQSPENQAIQMEIESVRLAFATANPGFELWVNPEIRSLDIQLANWNRNESVSRAAVDLLAAFREWLDSAAVKGMPSANVPQAAAKFLTDSVPNPIPTLAAPGLSPHGQMRAIDFQIQKDGSLVAGPSTATTVSAWDAPGWTEKLKAAVRAGSNRFTGPLESPREPWHYTYSPAPQE